MTRRFSENKIAIGLIVFFYFMLLLDLKGADLPQKKKISKRISIGLEVGNWQPHSINDEPSFITFGAAGATPFIGLGFCLPLFSDLGLRISLGYWALRDLDKIEKVHSLTLHPITVEIKYWLVPDPVLSAYVLYGGGLYWGVENETEPFGQKLSEARGGWGATLGAGIDVSISKKLGLGLAFQYHYVRFKEPLGGVQDFSGPKITGMIFYYLNSK